MNSKLFNELPNLKLIDMTANDCIDKIFDEANLQKFAYVAKQKCRRSRTAYDALELNCGELYNCTYGLCCEMEVETKITGKDSKIVGSESEKFQKLDFSYNKNIEFLPLSTSYLSSLIAYIAWNCAIQEIHKESLTGMVWLEILELNKNRITAIQSDTFDGLVRLELINLSK